MKYNYSQKWTEKAREIVKALELGHIDLARVVVIESKGSKSKRTLARIHALGKVMQLGMGVKPFYTIELITEKFDKQNPDDQVRTIIHELLHIPHSFGGGFRHHRRHVNSGTVEKEFKKLQELYT